MSARTTSKSRLVNVSRASVAEAADATEEVATQFPRVAPEPAPPVQEAPDAQDAQDQPPPPPEEERRLRTWELPTLEVVGSGLKEEERVGRYRQPRWTVERLFPLIDEAALAAVRQWTFVPAVQGGVAVAGYVRRPISFTLAR